MINCLYTQSHDLCAVFFINRKTRKGFKKINLIFLQLLDRQYWRVYENNISNLNKACVVLKKSQNCVLYDFQITSMVGQRSPYRSLQLTIIYGSYEHVIGMTRQITRDCAGSTRNRQKSKNGKETRLSTNSGTFRFALITPWELHN